MLLAAIVLVLAQAGIGTAVNLYATVPPSQCQDRVSLTMIWPPSITQAWLELPGSHCHR